MQTHRWWGTHEVDEGKGLRFRIGPCHLVALRTEDSWQIAVRYEDDALDKTTHEPIPVTELPDEPGFQVTRYGAGLDPSPLHLAPALPDRPVVAKPEHDYCLLPLSHADFYMGVLLWARLTTGSEQKLLAEVPLHRAADTWFGPNTMEGELCYASLTRLHTRVTGLHVAPHRAVIPITIDNRGRETVWLHRLRIPVPNLTMFAGGSGRIWTERVTLLRERGDVGDISNMRIASGPPGEIGQDVTVAAPAREEPGGELTQMLGSLLR